MPLHQARRTGEPASASQIAELQVLLAVLGDAGVMLENALGLAHAADPERRRALPAGTVLHTTAAAAAALEGTRALVADVDPAAALHLDLIERMQRTLRLRPPR